MDKNKTESLLNKVREFFSANDVEVDIVEKAEKFESMLLADGVTEVTIEPAVEVGAAIVIAAEDGTPIAAPASEYELADGRVIVVAEDGVIAEVKEASTDEVEEPMADDAPSNADKVKKVIERIETEKVFDRVAEMEVSLAKEAELNKFLKAENETLVDQFNELKTFTKETFESLLSEPSKEPVQEKVNPLKAFRNETSSIEDFLNKHN
jgi:hypothetical protein